MSCRPAFSIRILCITYAIEEARKGAGVAPLPIMEAQIAIWASSEVTILLGPPG